MRIARMPNVSRPLGWSLAAVLTAFASSSFAQSPPRDPATAQALFEAGKQLMQRHQFADACPKFAESQRLDPGGGTLFALALCHEGAGKTASAWADFNEALSDARQSNRADRTESALQHIRKLEAQLTRMRIHVTQDVEGLEIRRNGAVIGKAAWTVPVPIDPGTYTFEAHAPNKKTWSAPIALNGAGQTVDVNIPALEDDRSAMVVAPPVAHPAAPTPHPASPLTPPPPETSSSFSIVPAVIAGGVGVVGIVIGAVEGASAKSNWNSALADCPNATCDSTHYNQANGYKNNANSAATASTVFFVVGAVGLATSAVLLGFSLSSSSSKPSDQPTASTFHIAPAVGPGTGGVVLGGSFQ
jgi:hypothetical protein